MLGGIFHKRKKSQELRSPSLQDLKKFRDAYAKYAELRQVETPPCFEKSIYKAIAGQKEMHSVEFRQEDITDPHTIALAEALLEVPMISSLDLRDNRITNDGAKALLEVLRLQIITAKTPPTIDPRTKQPLYPPQPEYTRYITNVNLKGNGVSPSVLQEISQYIDVLRREDKRLEIRAALNRIDRTNDGTIDEDEFKGVLKLLTASTPTKKEIRAFMQQHTLSTDSTQNVINLENVLLAKCATSPSRHSASPPWEALVQERHAILGAPRMAPTMMTTLPESPPSRALQSRPSLPSSGSGLSTGTANPFLRSNSAPDDTPPATPSSQIAPVAPLEMKNLMTKRPSTSTLSVPGVPPQSQHATEIPEPKSGSISSEATTFTKPPAIPILPLASLAQSSVSPSPRSARSSVDDEGQKNPSLTRERGSVISAPSSPHDSDISDSMSVVSSAFSASVSQRVMEDHEHANGTERKLHAVSTMSAATTHLDAPRWQSDHFSGEDDEGTSSSWLSGAREDVDALSSGDADEGWSGYTHRPAKSVVTSVSSVNELSGNKSLSGASRRESSFPGNEAPRDLPMRSEVSNVGHDEKRSLPGSVISTPRLDDLSSLQYRGTEEGSKPTFPGHTETTDFPSHQPEDDEEVEDQVDSLIFEVTKDGKERSVVKLIHSEFRSGLTVKDFPAELPFRNLLALLLPDNGLSDLALFSQCRFPFTLVLDLSRNKLAKLANNDLTAFPRLEVLNLANNQLKTITGFSKMFKLRALGLSHNSIRSVQNVEHIAPLEILQLANNQIATVHALRQLSLNKVLAHLDLDGNPVVETDERQKRKNIVHVRNLLPALQSLGSNPFVGLKDKKKTSSDVNPGKSLFESDVMPDYKTLWVTTACDELHILQDIMNHSSRQSQRDDDDAWDTRDEDGDADRPMKPLTREQQRQKDEQRSRAIGFRSRGKAIPSPPKVKMSVYCFGKPQLPPGKKKKKKPAPADPGVVREQQRRASELSAPKHGTVDKNLMQLEQKRKSRVDFHAAMTVGERLQLTRDLTQRRPTASVGLSARSKSILAKADIRKRASTVISVSEKEEEAEPEDNSKPVSRSPSPQRPSPMKDAMVFRIDPANTPRSPKGVLSFRVDPYPTENAGPPSISQPNGSKEAGFLHDLAVSDFLNHAEEEFSTALTALNVLLSMSEKELGDRKKLSDYRASLDALDILNEHESHDLFTKTQGTPEHELQAQCTEWFTKLGVVKKSMRQLLEKLELHAPGSGVIRAYCRSIRSNELRGIITTMLEAQEEAIGQDNASYVAEVEPAQDTYQKHEQRSSNDSTDDKLSLASSEVGSVTSRIFAVPTSPTIPEADSISENDASAVNGAIPSDAHASDDNDLDFLDSTDSVFDVKETEEKNEDTPTEEPIGEDGNSFELQDEAVVADPVLSAAPTDITMDIQTNGADSIQNADITQWTDDAVEDDNLRVAFDETSESVDECGGESFDHTETKDEATSFTTPVDAPASQNDDFDCLASSSEPQAGNAEADSFEHETDAATENEPNDEIDQEEQTEEDSFEHEMNAASENDENDQQEQLEADSFEHEMDAVSENEAIDEIYHEEQLEADSFGHEMDAVSENEANDEEEQVEVDSFGHEMDAASENEAIDQAEAAQDYDWSNSETPIDEGVNEVFDGETHKQEELNDDNVEDVYSADTEIAPDETETTEAAELEPGEGVDADDEEAETFGDWEKGFDPNSNHYFWFNHNTGESAWTPPEGWPHEVDEPFEEGADAGEDPQEQEFDEGAAEAQEYDSNTAEGQECEENDQEVSGEGHCYEDGAAEEGQYYEEGAAEEGQYYEEGAVEGQYYEEGATEGQEYEEAPAEEQQYEAPADGEWYDETATEDQEQQAEQTGEESPRRSEVSDFEFDDSDLPGF